MTDKITVIGDRPLQHNRNITAFFKKVIETAKEHNLEPLEYPETIKDKPSINGRPRITLVTAEYNENARKKRNAKTLVVQEEQETAEQYQSTEESTTESVEIAEPAKEEVEKEEESVVDPLDVLKTKDELLAYAKELGLEVPEDMNKPLAIKKFIRENTSK